ncbi:MAG: DUF1501 domain-containing protein [Verrucomicrobiales bacterium]|nr:DUF1501 domain-containing protein [Verrucomicrobiales bacterium]
MATFQHPISRRQLLGGLGGAALLARLGRINALAQNSPPDYKALVCVFLTGGNDGHNTVVPLTQAQFDAYQAARGSLALPDNNGALLPVETPDGTPYGLNPGLTAIHPLWAQGHLAVLANTGMLVQPVTRPQFLANSAPVPTNLFSHSDQIQQMQSGIPSTSGSSGWGARAADRVNTLNGTSTFPASISVTGPSLFCTGQIVQSASLLPGFNLDPSGLQLWPQSAATARRTGMQQVLEFDSGLALVQAANKVRQDALGLNAMLTGTSATVGTSFPGTLLGNQLLQVAKIIKLRSSTGLQRQVFFCSLGGFDTHGAQSWQHWDLLSQVSEALAAFHTATLELGVADRVTAFTLSDFGRTLQPSGGGSDHGWGNHHLILGGAVQGGRVYGTFPNLALGGPDDSGTRGALIPSTSIDQYGATLASWFGVAPADLPSVFPNLPHFTNANLGFLG